MKKILLIAFGVGFLIAQNMTVYKSPTCGCCTMWIKGVSSLKFKTKIVHENNLYQTKRNLGVPQEVSSCHTAIVGDYIIEGHVPLSAVKRLLKEKPKNIAGIGVGGMPLGSLGMEYGDRKQPYNVMAFNKSGKLSIYERH